MQLRKEGARAALLYVVQRGDCDSVEPADDIDPAYGETLRSAAAAGVQILAIGTRVLAHGISAEKLLPVRLDPGRLESWRKLQRELAFQARRQDQRIYLDEKRRWKQMTKSNRKRTQEALKRKP